MKIVFNASDNTQTKMSALQVNNGRKTFEDVQNSLSYSLAPNRSFENGAEEMNYTNTTFSILINKSPRESTPDVPTNSTPTTMCTLPPQTWFFNLETRELCNAKAAIKLTNTESLIINTMTNSTERISSKLELIIGINKDPLAYSGLEMCLSRLQNKFKKTYSERLFRSVRNRGYCLVQDIKLTDLTR